MSWAWVWLGEPVSPTFWTAMVLILAGVMLSQIGWGRLASARVLASER